MDPPYDFAQRPPFARSIIDFDHFAVFKNGLGYFALVKNLENIKLSL